MVSNSLNMELQDLLETLERVQRECGTNPEYQELRRGSAGGVAHVTVAVGGGTPQALARRPPTVMDCHG